jgi:hypothetical protein
MEVVVKFSRAFLTIGFTAISVGCPAPASSPAGDPFVGDWKLNPSRSKVTDLMKVQSVNGNTYAFDFGGGGETIVTDGTDQPGNSGTTLAVTEEPDGWKVVRKKNGSTFISALWKLSQDGNTLSDDYTEFAQDGQVAVHAHYLYHRTAEGRGFAGAWEGTIAMENSQSSMLQIRSYGADGLSFNYLSAQLTRNLKFDGKDYPVVGPGAAESSTTAARWVDNHTLELTDKSHGKITRTYQIELSRDRRTVTQTAHPVGQLTDDLRV